jgi:hypothetical protein
MGDATCKEPLGYAYNIWSKNFGKKPHRKTKNRAGAEQIKLAQYIKGF